jgi:hypothetical protein
VLLHYIFSSSLTSENKSTKGKIDTLEASFLLFSCSNKIWLFLHPGLGSTQQAKTKLELQEVAI